MGVGDRPDPSGTPDRDRPVQLTAVGDEQEASIICGALRHAGIRCAYLPSARLPAGHGGAILELRRLVRGPSFAVFVAASDRDEARAVLEAGDPSGSERWNGPDRSGMPWEP